jgi:hypothetical protein
MASLNAFNLWGVLAHAGGSRFVSDRQPFLIGVNYQRWGEIFLAAAMLIVLVLFWRRPTREMALWAAFATTFSLFMLPTRVHERYLLPAVVLALPVAAIMPRIRWLAMLLSLTYLADLVAVYAELGKPTVRPVGGRLDPLVLAVSSVNLVLLGAVFALGSTLAAQPPTETGSIRIRPRRLAVSLGIVAAILTAALVTGAARDQIAIGSAGFGDATRGPCARQSGSGDSALAPTPGCGRQSSTGVESRSR